MAEISKRDVDCVLAVRWLRLGWQARFYGNRMLVCLSGAPYPPGYHLHKYFPGRCEPLKERHRERRASGDNGKEWQLASAW